MSLLKKVEELTVEDLQAIPVWEYTNSHEEIGETIVRPVKTTPVKSLTGRVVGTQVRLANGSAMWALLGSVDATNPRLTQHFLMLSVFAEGRWFTMARYFDFDSDVRGPHALSAFLRSPIDSVFPISYDIGGYCVGQRAALVGTVETEPRERLTRAEIIALAVP